MSKKRRKFGNGPSEFPKIHRVERKKPRQRYGARVILVKELVQETESLPQKVDVPESSGLLTERKA